MTKVALPKAQGVQNSSLCNPVSRHGRRICSPQGAHRTVVDEEEGEPQPRTSFTYGGGTVLGVLFSLIVQAMV